MPRIKRIEYAEAIYHVTARGDRREDIVLDDEDRRRFEETLEEVVTKSGWTCYAWVLLDNHYHLAFQTPEPNLVRGMAWFQNMWTKRFNSRHGVSGHLFGGRYKAVLVEEGDYVRRLIHYIHLNPVRAGFVSEAEGLGSYRWSSLMDYCSPPRVRRGWVDVAAGLAQLGMPDTEQNRLRFVEGLKSMVDWNNRIDAGFNVSPEETLQSTLRRGWYFGSDAFRNALLERLGGEMAMAGSGIGRLRRNGYTGEQTRDLGIYEADRIVEKAEKLFGIENGNWSSLPKGDWRKGLTAHVIRTRALVGNRWLANRLHMGARSSLSRTVGEAIRRTEMEGEVETLLRQLQQMAKGA